MNRKIIKNFKLKIYIILILLIIHKNIQTIYYIYLFNHIHREKLSKKIKENMKHKEKDEKKRIEKDKTDP